MNASNIDTCPNCKSRDLDGPWGTVVFCNGCGRGIYLDGTMTPPPKIKTPPRNPLPHRGKKKDAQP